MQSRMIFLHSDHDGHYLWGCSSCQTTFRVCCGYPSIEQLGDITTHGDNLKYEELKQFRFCPGCGTRFTHLVYGYMGEVGAAAELMQNCPDLYYGYIKRVQAIPLGPDKKE